MTKGYFERRVSAARGTDSLAADIMRHLHARQHLGKAIIVGPAPIVMLSAGRKQWLKLSRTVQRQRAATLNADKILKYTYTIARMQHMRFTSKTPEELPSGDVFYLSPEQVASVPAHCFSVYTTVRLPEKTAQTIIRQLPDNGLVIDYEHSFNWEELTLEPKTMLEKQVGTVWKQVRSFLKAQAIDPRALYTDEYQNMEAMDNALDILLNATSAFLEVANMFYHAFELARPLRVQKDTRMQYDSVALLAHRVQALSPGIFTQRFLETYNEDDSFFLYDVGKDIMGDEKLADAIQRHNKAGRFNLAKALAAHHNRTVQRQARTRLVFP